MLALLLWYITSLTHACTSVLCTRHYALLCLQYRLDLLAAYLGLGSCWAMTGRMQEAVHAFSSAIELDPEV